MQTCLSKRFNQIVPRPDGKEELKNQEKHGKCRAKRGRTSGRKERKGSDVQFNPLLKQKVPKKKEGKMFDTLSETR